jgi:hypothetical protein
VRPSRKTATLDVSALTAEPFYAALGYRVERRGEPRIATGVAISAVTMRKSLELLLGSFLDEVFLRRTQRFVASVNAAHKTARAAHPVMKFQAHPFNMLASGLRFLHRNDPANPLIASQWRQSLPYLHSGGIRS